MPMSAPAAIDNSSQIFCRSITREKAKGKSKKAKVKDEERASHLPLLPFAFLLFAFFRL
jgi:hypothetical protein